MKNLIKAYLDNLGYTISRSQSPFPAASPSRSVGSMKMLLEDLSRRGLSPTSILDVGANCTSWSRLAKVIFPLANCFLIEPQVEMYKELEKFCSDFLGSKFFLVAVGDTEEIKVLTVWEDLAGSSLLPPESKDLISLGKQRLVEVTTIDSLINKGLIHLPQLVKLDIQGFELKALLGANKLFETTEAFIIEVSLFEFMEGQPVFSDVIVFMKERGYVVYDFPGFSRRPFAGSLGQVDICFVKNEGLFRKNNYWD